MNWTTTISHTFQLLAKFLTIHDTTWPLSSHQLLNPLCRSCTLVPTLHLTPSMCFLACSLETNCAPNGDELMPNTIRLNWSISGFEVGSNFLHILWYFWSSGWIPVLKYNSAMPQTNATACLLNRNPNFTRSCCNFGPW